MLIQMNSRRLAGYLLTLGVAATCAFPSIARAQSAKEIYADKCASCHGETGKGDGPAAKVLKPAPGGFAEKLRGKPDYWIRKSISGGGEAVGLDAVMPTYKDLSKEQLNDLVAYIKQLGS